MNAITSKVAVITGASSGVGRATAIALAAKGWRIIGQGRDSARCNQASAEIWSAAAFEAQVDILRADLTLLSDVAHLAEQILALTDEIHVLINNAGGVRDRMIITPEGNEATFAGNHLGPFYLTNLLLPTMRRTASASSPGSVRVINVSSSGHERSQGIDWDDLQQTNNWVSGKNYCLAKLCNLLFTRELAKRITPYGMIAHAMHPGEVASNFTSHATPEMRALTQHTIRVAPETPARTLQWLATDAAVGARTGRYFFDHAEVAPSSLALDDVVAERLWRESERLVESAGFSIPSPTSTKPAAV